MSIFRWKQQFYPKNIELSSFTKALDSEILKWQGLASNNLWVYWITKLDANKHLYDEPPGYNKEVKYFPIDRSTCFLCKYSAKNLDDVEYCCDSCLLYQESPQTCFDAYSKTGKSHYRLFIEMGDQQPILNSLIKLSIN